MPIRITTPATVFPVTLSEAKEHLRVDGTAEDDYIAGLVAAATSHVEVHCGRSYSAQGLTLYLHTFAPEIVLLRGPVSEVSSVQYLDEAGVLQTLSASVYDTDLFSDPATITLAAGQSWPAVAQRRNAVQIEYTVGAGDAPKPVKMAIKLLVGQWFEMRSAVNDKIIYELPNGIAAVLANHRSYGF